MKGNLPMELLRSAWMIRADALDHYRPYLKAYLTRALESGNTIELDLFSEIAAPDVPANVALITMSGVLTKADICGGKGTRSLTNQLLQAAHDPKYDAILLYAEDCPGGQVDGTKSMADAVNIAKNLKPVVSAFSGMCCSAGVWIQSQGTEFYATSETDMVGCIGVMATVSNPNKKNDNEDFIEIYSDLSPNKNIEDRDHKVYKENLLNPAAKLFQQDVRSGRGKKLKLKEDDVLSGYTYTAMDGAKFGLIDGVMPINKIIARALFLARTKK